MQEYTQSVCVYMYEIIHCSESGCVLMLCRSLHFFLAYIPRQRPDANKSEVYKHIFRQKLHTWQKEEMTLEMTPLTVGLFDFSINTSTFLVYYAETTVSRLKASRYATVV